MGSRHGVFTAAGHQELQDGNGRWQKGVYTLNIPKAGGWVHVRDVNWEWGSAEKCVVSMWMLTCVLCENMLYYSSHHPSSRLVSHPCINTCITSNAQPQPLHEYDNPVLMHRSTLSLLPASVSSSRSLGQGLGCPVRSDVPALPGAPLPRPLLGTVPVPAVGGHNNGGGG